MLVWLPSASSQSKSVLIEDKLKTYLKKLKKQNIDSYVIMKKIYTRDVSMSDGGIIPARSSIYVISKSKGKYQLKQINNTSDNPIISVNAATFFKEAKQRTPFFKAKDTYFQNRLGDKKVYFIPPKQAHLSTTLILNLPDEKNELEIVDEEFHPNGERISNKPWFIPIKSIVDSFNKVIAENK